MDEQAYSDDIVERANADLQRQIETMTPAKAFRIVKNARILLQDFSDPEGKNLDTEVQLDIVALWLAKMEGQA
jgi:hypothetical protein